MAGNRESRSIPQVLLVTMLCFCISSCVAIEGCKGKSSWPELVGFDGLVAVTIIQHENPYVNAGLVKEGSFVTMDFRCDRVRVWISKTNGTVIRTPIIG